ncbi:MAG: Lrp/AsnC family transcriptional regulator [Pseudomonadota bacterium]
MKLDRIDKAILAALQTNARISNVDLANQVGLSPSACSRRLEQLEKSCVIENYQALISNRALGQTITAVVHVTLDRQAGTELESFENAIIACPHIVACFLMSGEHDYILRVNARDMEHFEYIHKHWLSSLPGIARMQSSFAMRTVVNRANIDLANIDGT